MDNNNVNAMSVKDISFDFGPMKVGSWDFDGTLCQHAFPQIGMLNNGIVNILKERKAAGDWIIIWTCRSEENNGIKPLKEWLAKHEIPYDGINENPPWLNFSTSNKIYADYYVDDRSVPPCNFVSPSILASHLEKIESKFEVNLKITPKHKIFLDYLPTVFNEDVWGIINTIKVRGFGHLSASQFYTMESKFNLKWSSEELFELED